MKSLIKDEELLYWYDHFIKPGIHEIDQDDISENEKFVIRQVLESLPKGYKVAYIGDNNVKIANIDFLQPKNYLSILKELYCYNLIIVDKKTCNISVRDIKNYIIDTGIHRDVAIIIG